MVELSKQQRAPLYEVSETKAFVSKTKERALSILQRAPAKEKTLRIRKPQHLFLDNYLPQVVTSMNALYADSYPANIFKNATKCKEIYKKMMADA